MSTRFARLQPPAPKETAHDRVRHACRAVSGSAAEAARWERWLRRLCDHPQSSASNLAAGGDPVEFQMVWRDAASRAGIRASIDPCPDGTAATRLARCLAVVQAPEAGQRLFRNRLIQAQQTGRRRFGGWVGLRFRGRRALNKLYLEVPAGTPWQQWPETAPLRSRNLPVRALRPILVGFGPGCGHGDGGLEFYCSVAPIVRDALPIMLAAFDLPPATRAFTALLTDLLQQRLRPRLPADDQGLSIAIQPCGTIEAVTWYVHCDDLLGPAGQARRRLLAFGRARGWNMTPYAELTAPDRRGRIPWHGPIGLTVARDAGLTLAVSCSTRPGAVEA